jgi:CubicO group peptidase (beta-lactamase class C family)
VFYLGTNQTPSKKYGITQESIAFLEELGKSKKVILSLFGNPYALDHFKSLNKFDAAVVAYQRTENSMRAALQGIFGMVPFEGLLPVSVLNYKSLTNANTDQKAKSGLWYEVCGMRNTVCKEIDEMINNGIKENILPGCQVLVLKNGKPLFVKNYGTTNYQKQNRVTDRTIYDVASLTKPLATTLALMKLYDEKKFSLKDTIGQYVEWVRGSDKGGLRIEELLTHTAGLPAFIPFHKRLMNDSMAAIYLNNIETETFNIPIAKNLFLNHVFQDTIKQIICEVNLKSKKYQYSDLGIILLKEMVEKIIQKPCEEYIYSEFYKPLQLADTYFNPALKGIDLERIAPTENDTLFRKHVVQGYVHDQASALLGGFAGNAGLFSTAHDLAIILEMLMNKGSYHGKRYLSEKTVQLFTSSYSCNGSKRRGLGFDVPSAEKPSEIIPAKASANTFGHQGFTGTVFWCDPKENLTYIFISNRVYPNTEPNLLSKSKIRLLVHEKIYEGIEP